MGVSVTHYDPAKRIVLPHSYFREKGTPSYIFLIMSITSKTYRKRTNGIAPYKETLEH